MTTPQDLAAQIEALDALKWANERLHALGKMNGFSLGMCVTLDASVKREAAARANLPAIGAAIRQGENSKPVGFLIFDKIDGTFEFSETRIADGDLSSSFEQTAVYDHPSPPAPDERDDEVRKALVQLVRALECGGEQASVVQDALIDARAAILPAKGGEA